MILAPLSAASDVSALAALPPVRSMLSRLKGKLLPIGLTTGSLDAQSDYVSHHEYYCVALGIESRVLRSADGMVGHIMCFSG